MVEKKRDSSEYEEPLVFRGLGGEILPCIRKCVIDRTNSPAELVIQLSIFNKMRRDLLAVAMEIPPDKIHSCAGPPLTLASQMRTVTTCRITDSVEMDEVFFGNIRKDPLMLEPDRIFASARLGNNFVTDITFAPQNSVWFSTFGGGLSRYHRTDVAPETRILTDFDIITDNSMTFEFTGLDLTTATNQLRYSHKLDFSAWSKPSFDSFATLPVTNAGRHTFYVKAIDSAVMRCAYWRFVHHRTRVCQPQCQCSTAHIFSGWRWPRTRNDALV